MRIKSWKYVVLAAATCSIAALTPVVTSCTVHWHEEEEEDEPEEEPKLTEVKMTLPTDIPTRIKAGESQTTEPLVVECYDQKGHTMVASTDFLFTDDMGRTPEWIKIGKLDNKFHINANVPIRTYNFKIKAIGVQNGLTVESTEQYFSLTVFDDDPILGPDEIKILCDETNPTVLTTSSADIRMDIEAFKSDYPTRLVEKECDWDFVDYPDYVDLSGNPLFYIRKDLDGATLVMSTDVDGTYAQTYNLTIAAISIMQPFASDRISLTINVLDGLAFYDEENHYAYTRTSINTNWELTRVDNTPATITKAKSEIYGKPVSKIANDFASNSHLDRVSAVLLPDSYTIIGKRAFYGLSSLYGMEMPGVKWVEESAFEGCDHLSLYTSKPHPVLENVGKRAFYNCKLFDLNSANDFAEIGEQAFANTSIKNIDLGSCVWSLGSNCFDGCEKLESITIGASNPPKLGGGLYVSGTPLKYIYVPKNSAENYKNSRYWSIYGEKIIEKA